MTSDGESALLVTSPIQKGHLRHHCVEHKIMCYNNDCRKGKALCEHNKIVDRSVFGMVQQWTTDKLMSLGSQN